MKNKMRIRQRKIFMLSLLQLITTIVANAQLEADIVHATQPSYDNGKLFLKIGTNVVPPYTIEWDNGSNSNPLINLEPGEYCVTIVDYTCCLKNECFEVLSCPNLNSNAQVQYASGPQSFDGMISLNPTGGTPPYFYDWNIDNNTSTASNLAAYFEYCYEVRDNVGCITENCITMGACNLEILTTPTCVCPAPPNASYTPYGAVSVEVSGNSTYTYAWSGTGQISNPTLQNPLVYATGTYSVTVTDSQTGCTVSGEVTVGECQVDLQSLVQVVPDCNEEGTSTLSIQLPTGYGVGPFEFRWLRNGEELEFDPSTDGFASLENASEGEYCLNIRTVNGCDDDICGIQVKKMTKPVVIPQITPVSGNNANDGAISLTVDGGIGPFTYLWNTGATTPSIHNLPAGWYTVTVTDTETGCSTISQVIKVISCTTLDFNLANFGGIPAEVGAATPENGGGSIDILLSSIYPGIPFTFNWETGDTTEDLNGLSPGRYYVTVSEPNCGLSWFDDWEICDFIINVEEEWHNCTEVKLTADIMPSGDYEFSWNTNNTYSTDQSISSTTGTEYYLVVTSIGSNCSGSVIGTPLLNGDDIEITLVSLENDSYGLPANGSITVTAMGGYPPHGIGYQYAWSNGVSGPTISSLKAGTYTVTVTDECGNTATASYDISCEILESSIVGQVTNVSCADNHGGSIELTQLPFQQSGHSFAHQYLWSNGETSRNIYNLAAGEYCVTITEEATQCIGFKCFEVRSDGNADINISFTEVPGCYPLSEGEITAVVSPVESGPFAYSWTTLDWLTYSLVNLGSTETISDVPAGWYTVVVTDALGCTASNYTLMYPGPPSFSIWLDGTSPIGVCDGETASAQIETSLGGGHQGTMSYTWANGSQFPSVPIQTNGTYLDGLTPGSWSVTATDGNGCQAFAHFRVDKSNIRVGSRIVAKCHTASILLTPNNSAQGSFLPFAYLWSDGSTSEDRANLPEGSYSVTVTDAIGCTKVLGPFNIEYLDIQLLTGSTVIDNGCMSTDNGEIILELNPEVPNISIKWDDVANYVPPHHRKLIKSGNYYVTLTTPTCVEQHMFTVGQAGNEPFDYEVEVLHYFGNEIGPIPSGDAKIIITSDLFQQKPNSIKVYSSSEMIEANRIATAHTQDGTTANIFIPVEQQEKTTFYFTYTAPNGCTYNGSFPGIPICIDDPTDKFNFEVNYSGNQQIACAANQSHTYELVNCNFGENYPYFLEVTMSDAFSLAESGYEQTIVINSYEPSITVEGVPAGTVQFRTYNKCHEDMYLRTHNNCCRPFTCEPINYDTGPEFGGYQFWDFAHFRLQAEKSIGCFVKCPNPWPFGDDCSKVKVLLHEGPTSEYNCWTGLVTITYGNGLTYKFRVKNEPNEIVYESGSNEWEPSSAGNYPINIVYDGDQGMADCSTTVMVNYYGEDNPNDVVGFNHNLQYNPVNFGFPPEMTDAYFTSWRCGVCERDIDYIMNNEQGICDFDDNWISTYFLFTPNDVTEEFPCKTGGMLTIIDFDGTGKADVIEVEVPMNPAIVLGEINAPDLINMQPFQNTNKKIWCDRFGFCLLDPNLLPDPTYGAEIDKPLLVSWVDESTCHPTYSGDPNSPNFDPCGPDQDCPGGGVCYEGSCYPPCLEGECQSGECTEVTIDGETVSICIVNEDSECDPPCDEDEVCLEGECFPGNGPNICSFDDQIMSGSGSNVYNFYHTLPIGTPILFEYNRFFQPDEFQVIGSGINLNIPCAGGSVGWEDTTFVTSEPPPNLISIVATPCPEEQTSNYAIRLSCDDNLFNLPDGELGLTVQGLKNSVSVYPSPFSTKFNILATIEEEPFEGQISMLDNLGREIFAKEAFFENGQNIIPMEYLDGLPEGLYLVMIKKAGKVYASKKIIKSR
jgi:hypothetical protein